MTKQDNISYRSLGMYEAVIQHVNVLLKHSFDADDTVQEIKEYLATIPASLKEIEDTAEGD